jgi:hypothetical protein
VELVADNVLSIENSTYVVFASEAKHIKVNYQVLPKAVGKKN